MADNSRVTAHAVGVEPALWTCAVELYGVPTIRDVCLSLQDTTGADVNLLLTLLFAATRRLELDASRVRRLQESIAPWRGGVIEPLRSARRSIRLANRADAADAYESTKQAELAAEKVALQMLERELQSFELQARAADAAVVAGANLRAYAEHIALPEEPRARLIAAFAQFVQSRSPK